MAGELPCGRPLVRSRFWFAIVPELAQTPRGPSLIHDFGRLHEFLCVTRSERSRVQFRELSLCKPLHDRQIFLLGRFMIKRRYIARYMDVDAHLVQVARN